MILTELLRSSSHKVPLSSFMRRRTMAWSWERSWERSSNLLLKTYIPTRIHTRKLSKAKSFEKGKDVEMCRYP
jgi:hypothetical protein